MSDTVESLRQLPNWGGNFPRAHEFSTLEGLDFEASHATRARQVANFLLENWDERTNVGLWVQGEPGTGKTHFAIGLGRALAEKSEANLVAYQWLPGQNGMIYNHYNQSLSHSEGQHEPSGIFGEQVKSDISWKGEYAGRILILDDYTPEYRLNFIAATEQAAEAGGMVIVTSNYDSIFSTLRGENIATEEKIVMRDLAQRADPEAVATARSHEEDTESRISASLASRLAAAYMTLTFSGPDRRQEKSFWNNLPPEDFMPEDIIGR